MNTLRLSFFGLGLALLVSTSNAQVYSPRRLTRRIVPPPAQPARPASPNTAPAPSAPAMAAPAPVQSATNAPASVSTNRLVYRPSPPPVDPGKARAAKEEAVRKTVEFQKKRADEGSESAQYELGVRYLKGDGVEKDEATARKWLTLSSKNGYGPATRKLEEIDHTAKSPAGK